MERRPTRCWDGVAGWRCGRRGSALLWAAAVDGEPAGATALRAPIFEEAGRVDRRPTRWWDGVGGCRRLRLARRCDSAKGCRCGL